MKVEYFFERYSGPITSPRVERVYAWRVTMAIYLAAKKKRKLKEIFDSWFFEKVWLKAAKSVSGKWTLLKFVRETRTKSPYLRSKVTLPQLLTSFCVVTKRRNDLQPTGGGWGFVYFSNFTYVTYCDFACLWSFIACLRWYSIVCGWL